MLKSKGVLCEALGKGMGETLYNLIRGVDGTKLESCKERKSVSCDITVGLGPLIIVLRKSDVVMSTGYGSRGRSR